MTMNRWIGSMMLLSLGMVTALGQVSFAQESGAAAALTPDTYSPDELMAMEKTLAAKADAAGLATETVKKYSTDYTLLAFRSQSGKAELHDKFADFYVVIDGSATLVSGGTIANAKTTAPGEVRGDSVQDGKETKLKKGDIVHIPANIPHQLVLAKGDTFKYFVIKVQEVN
jgi:mannose-6-phosphate isomerase-like protein (cupin superfamily)